MTDEEIKFLDDNAVVTKTAEGVSVHLHTPLFRGFSHGPKIFLTQAHVTEWLEGKGHKNLVSLNSATFRNHEEANRNKTWNFSLAKKTKPAKVTPAKPTKTKKTGKAKQTTNEG